MLPNVRQATIKPIITKAVAPATLIQTDAYDMHALLSEWGYAHTAAFWLPLYLSFFQLHDSTPTRQGPARCPSGCSRGMKHVTTLEGDKSLKILLPFCQAFRRRSHIILRPAIAEPHKPVTTSTIKIQARADRHPSLPQHTRAKIRAVVRPIAHVGK